MFTLLMITLIWTAYFIEVNLLPTLTSDPAELSIWVPITGTVLFTLLHWSTREKRPQTFQEYLEKENLTTEEPK